MRAADRRQCHGRMARPVEVMDPTSGVKRPSAFQEIVMLSVP